MDEDELIFRDKLSNLINDMESTPPASVKRIVAITYILEYLIDTVHIWTREKFKKGGFTQKVFEKVHKFNEYNIEEIEGMTMELAQYMYKLRNKLIIIENGDDHQAII
jgi:iron-sulfur cluster repair protein YtfE (RIC family)